MQNEMSGTGSDADIFHSLLILPSEVRSSAILSAQILHAPTSASDRPAWPNIPAASKTPTMLVLHCITVVKVGTCGSSFASNQTDNAIAALPLS